MLDALNAEWRRHPPVHHLVAAYLDYKPAEQRSAASDDAMLKQLVQSMPVTSGAPALDTSAWDAMQARDPQSGR